MNVQAATDAWLARLPTAQRLAAHAATDARLVGWIGGALVFLGVAALVARSGVLGALRRRLEADRPRPWLVSAAAVGALGLVLALAKAWVDGVAAWRIDVIRAGGGGAPPAAGLAAHLAAAMAAAPASVVAAVIFIPPLAWLMRRAPKRWPPIVGAAAFGLILALGWLPYALSAGAPTAPAPPSPAQQAVAGLIAESHLPAGAVRLSADPALDADVTGGFGRAIVVLGPAMLASPPAEARAYVGHLMGHYVHKDILVVCLVLGAVVFAGCFAVQAWTAPLARALGARSVRSPADPEALPALAMIGGATLVCAALAGAAYLRSANIGADAYSLDHAREPDGLVAVIERDWDHAAVDPSPLETALFYSHPPLTDRIRHAMAWKASHGG